uniref:Uncharacterized protein n=1 Tax=Lepeophtheirus salmonis TaxID=72036 RepID=A0A0K2TTY5_LEPSM
MLSPRHVLSITQISEALRTQSSSTGRPSLRTTSAMDTWPSVPSPSPWKLSLLSRRVTSIIR